MTKLKFQLHAAGFCVADRAHALRKTRKKQIRFYATYAHIEHPIHGHILFDTGYTRRFHQFTKKFPFNLYAKATPVTIMKEEEAIHVLADKGIKPEDIAYIIVSHFHADHIGGLQDFPTSKFICSKRAYDDVKKRQGISAVRRGFVPKLMPNDFEARVHLLDFNESSKSDAILGDIIDLFDDGSILLCQLDGHAKGMIGAVLDTEVQTFLVADAAWLKENYTKMHLPSPSVRLFFDSWKAYKDNLNKVYQYHKKFPETKIIPSHCEETLREITTTS